MIEQVADPDVQASLGHVGGAHEETDPYGTRYASTGASTSAGTRFRILRPHAKGGLGIVHVAHDGELNREVALKEIQEHHADDLDHRSKFVAEAEITGGLEHPGIVPVYGLGTDPTGRPYYAMRFIRGDSLHDALKKFHADGKPVGNRGERSVEFLKLLRRFLDVCNAIEYAHSRGILHRDLKPGNIMVGEYGETLVVDWGLAKSLDRPDSATTKVSAVRPSSSGSAATLPGSTVGTPLYMPPEQAAGRIAELGPASDVYSLGATLYDLLTGKPRFPGAANVEEILRRVQTGDFPPPRHHDPTIDPGLNAICTKALSLRPEDRYATPRALADDIERHLADEPTLALPDRPLDRLARWSRHHRAATLATAATLLSLTLAATTAALLIGQAQTATKRALNDRTEALKAQKQATDEKTAALAAQTLATEQKSVALAAETKAKEQMRDVFNKARKTVADLVQLIRDDRQLRETPALRPFRESLLKRALAFSQGFVKDYEGVADLRAEVANAYLHVGHFTQDTGQPLDAQQAYLKAIATYEALVAERPESDDYREALAMSCNNLGNLQIATGRPAEAERSHGRAREQFERLVAVRPKSDDYQHSLATTCSNLGNLQIATGRPVEAERNFNRARELHERLVAERPESDAYRNGLATTCNNLGHLQSDTDRPVEAERNFNRARELRERLVADRPESDAYCEGLASTCVNLGHLQFATGRPVEAERNFNRARELHERLVAERPESDAYRNGLARTCIGLGNLQTRTGRRVEGERSYNRAREQYERLVIERPENDTYREGLAMTCTNLGVLQHETGRLMEAERSNNRARELNERLVTEQPNMPRFRNSLGLSLSGLGGVQEGRGAFDESRRLFLAAVEHQRVALDKEQRNQFYRTCLDYAYSGLARVERRMGHHAEAATATSQRRSLWEGNPMGLYNAACDFALSVPIASDASAERARYADLAIETLGQAVAAGWGDFRHMANDPDLIPLRNRLDFRAMLAAMMDRAFPADPFGPVAPRR